MAAAAETKPPSTADPNVSAAFALGWHMAELYEKHMPDRRRPPDLPGLSDLSAGARISMLVDQVKVGVSALKDPVSQAGLPEIDLTELDGLGQRAGREDPVLAAHTELLSDLTAADFRLGKAYGLGRALADSCREPDDLTGLRKELNPFRIANLLRWLDDLGTAFPPHAADAVSKSLTRWRDALYPSPSSTRSARPGHWEPGWLKRLLQVRKRAIAAITPSAGGEGPDATTQEMSSVAPTIDPYVAVRTLRRQGQLWRALLSGEKQGTDMLEIDNYLDAARQMERRMAAILRGLIVRMPVLSFAVVALAGAGVWLLFQGSSAQLVGGATSILAALGLTWKGLGAALGKMIGKLERPLWGAVLDDAIADAITLLPDNKSDLRGRRQNAMTLAGRGALPRPPSAG